MKKTRMISFFIWLVVAFSLSNQYVFAYDGYFYGASGYDITQIDPTTMSITNSYTPGASFNGLTFIPVVPEPISSILFVTGGALLTGRRYIKRIKNNQLIDGERVPAVLFCF